jgi:CheY-like chemotaxis protein
VRLDGLKILVAEDSVDNQGLIRRILRRSGAEVELVENGRQAVDRALETPFDIILMDLQMPVLDGYGATAELRRRGYDRPIIALTAHAMREDCDKSMRAGCNDHLTKPLNIRRLIEKIRDYAGPAGPGYVH